MSNDYQIIIEGLKNKIELIIGKYEEVSSDNLRLVQELEQCKNDLNTSIHKNKELENKINNLQLIGAFTSSSSDVKEAKQKIGKIIKEIDRCIALLND